MNKFLKRKQARLTALQGSTITSLISRAEGFSGFRNQDYNVDIRLHLRLQKPFNVTKFPDIIKLHNEVSVYRLEDQRLKLEMNTQSPTNDYVDATATDAAWTLYKQNLEKRKVAKANWIALKAELGTVVVRAIYDVLKTNHGLKSDDVAYVIRCVREITVGKPEIYHLTANSPTTFTEEEEKYMRGEIVPDTTSSPRSVTRSNRNIAFDQDGGIWLPKLSLHRNQGKTSRAIPPVVDETTEIKYVPPAEPLV